MHLASMGRSQDALPFRDATLEDLDPDRIRRYIVLANASGRRHIPNDSEPLRVLEKLELIRENRPTLAALLLFESESQRKLLQATVHCGRFRELTIIVDDQLIGGPSRSRWNR